ncbi:MAG TPA: DUF1579 domain-containing protein [Bacteroidota bacterium]|nr:DUF1579 domain-containing protein [Bacteroidota bacterium]
MKRTLMFVCAVALASMVAVTPSTAQSKKAAKKKMPSQEEMMKAWQEAMTPGPNHKALEMFVGSWDVEAKIWMGGPKGEPAVSKGSAEYKMVLGGRYLEQDYTGEMMGQPFQGTGITGYDNFRKKFVGFWIDNFSTAMSTMEGTADHEAKTLTMTGKMDEPSTGEKDKKVKYVVRWIDDNTHVFESYDLSAYGDRKPVMVLTYKRK